MQKFQKNCKTLFSDLLESSNDMLFILDIQDENAKIMYANKAAVEKSGYTLDEMREIGIEGFRIPTEESKEFNEHIKELKEKGSMFDYAALLTKDKREIPVEANVKVVKTDDAIYNIAIFTSPAIPIAITTSGMLRWKMRLASFSFRWIIRPCVREECR